MSARRNVRDVGGYYPHNAAFDEDGRYMVGQVADANNNIVPDPREFPEPPSQATIRDQEDIDPATAHLRAPAAQMASLKPVPEGAREGAPYGRRWVDANGRFPQLRRVDLEELKARPPLYFTRCRHLPPCYLCAMSCPAQGECHPCSLTDFNYPPALVHKMPANLQPDIPKGQSGIPLFPMNHRTRHSRYYAAAGNLAEDDPRVGWAIDFEKWWDLSRTATRFKGTSAKYCDWDYFPHVLEVPEVSAVPKGEHVFNLEAITVRPKDPRDVYNFGPPRHIEVVQRYKGTREGAVISVPALDFGTELEAFKQESLEALDESLALTDAIFEDAREKGVLRRPIINTKRETFDNDLKAMQAAIRE